MSYLRSQDQHCRDVEQVARRRHEHCSHGESLDIFFLLFLMSLQNVHRDRAWEGKISMSWWSRACAQFFFDGSLGQFCLAVDLLCFATLSAYRLEEK